MFPSHIIAAIRGYVRAHRNTIRPTEVLQTRYTFVGAAIGTPFAIVLFPAFFYIEFFTFRFIHCLTRCLIYRTRRCFVGMTFQLWLLTCKTLDHAILHV